MKFLTRLVSVGVAVSMSVLFLGQSVMAASSLLNVSVDHVVFPENPQVYESVTIDVYFKNTGAAYSGATSLGLSGSLTTTDFTITSASDDYRSLGVDTFPANAVDKVRVKGYFRHAGTVNLTALIAEYVKSANTSNLTLASSSSNTYVTVQPALQSELVKSSSSPIVYWYSKGLRGRYVYPDEATYFTWYSNFSTVSTISDSDIAAMPLKGVVRVKPGIALVKIKTDPKVYAVDTGAVLRWVKTEDVARGLYGTDWNKKVLEIDATQFGRYVKGADISSTADFNVSNVINASWSTDAILY